jgi:hypothetical protein
LIRAPPVLPYDCGMNGMPGLPIPEQRRLALIGDSDCRDLAGINVSHAQHIAANREDAALDILRVVLDKTGPGKRLRKLSLRHGHDLHCFGEKDRPRRSCSLINGENA